MKKVINITIEVDMKCKQSREWAKPSQYLRNAILEAFNQIGNQTTINGKIKNTAVEIDNEEARLDYKVFVQTKLKR